MEGFYHEVFVMLLSLIITHKSTCRSSILKGLNQSAQGCEERATLGARPGVAPQLCKSCINGARGGAMQRFQR
jgi:hypothetical protein